MEQNWIVKDVLCEFSGGMAARDAARAAKQPEPRTSDFWMIDHQERHTPKVWKLFQLVDDETHPSGSRYIRIGQADTFDDAVAIAASVEA